MWLIFHTMYMFTKFGRQVLLVFVEEDGAMCKTMYTVPGIFCYNVFCLPDWLAGPYLVWGGGGGGVRGGFCQVSKSQDSPLRRVWLR